MDAAAKPTEVQPGEPEDTDALVALDQALGGLLGSGLEPVSGATAAAAVTEVERMARRLYAAQIELMDKIEQHGLHRGDGHANVKVLARHAAGLSNGEALDRLKTLRMLRALPLIKDALWVGAIGVEQVQLLARVFANPRVQGAMELRQERFVEQAAEFHYKVFEIRVREWERLIDEDGPEPANERTHRNRTARLTQNPIDLSWDLAAGFGAMQGAAMNEIFAHYIETEWQDDWDKARAEHGDNTCVTDLARTDAQRRADALGQIFEDAAAADGSEPMSPK